MKCGARRGSAASRRRRRSEPKALRGFPHEQHRAYRLKVASQRWRECAVQEAMRSLFDRGKR